MKAEFGKDLYEKLCQFWYLFWIVLVSRRHFSIKIKTIKQRSSSFTVTLNHGLRLLQGLGYSTDSERR